MTTYEQELLNDLAYGIIYNHDDAMTPTCVFCGCDELVDEPEHDSDCVYKKANDWINK